MNDTKQIQLIGCAEEDGVVAWVPDSDAQYWGVYLQAPETGQFEVIADFYVKEPAEDYVRWMASAQGYTIDDKTTLLNQQPRMVRGKL